MASSAKVVFYQQGVPITAAAQFNFLGIGSDGTVGAARILTHPNASLAPITYFSNPDEDVNFDNDILVQPIVNTIPTDRTTKVLRHERVLADMVVEEAWKGNDRRAAMPSFFVRLLFEYWDNHPSKTGNEGEFITWEPRDRNSKKWSVEFVSFTIGGQDARLVFNDLRDRGGLFKGEDIANALDDLNPVETGLVNREVRLKMKIVAEVV